MRKTNNKGITLVALVITIVVLLILAGVGVNYLNDDKHIINEAENQVSNAERQSLIEKIRADIYVQETVKNRSLNNTELEVILIKYGTVNYEGTEIKSITSNDGKYEIPYEEIVVNN